MGSVAHTHLLIQLPARDTCDHQIGEAKNNADSTTLRKVPSANEFCVYFATRVVCIILGTRTTLKATTNRVLESHRVFKKSSVIVKSVGLLLALKVNCCVIQTLEYTIIKHVFAHTHILSCREPIHCTSSMLALQPLVLRYCCQLHTAANG